MRNPESPSLAPVWGGDRDANASLHREARCARSLPVWIGRFHRPVVGGVAQPDGERELRAAHKGHLGRGQRITRLPRPSKRDAWLVHEVRPVDGQDLVAVGWVQVLVAHVCTTIHYIMIVALTSNMKKELDR